MKNVLLVIVVLIIVCASCTPPYQVYETKPISPMKVVNRSYCYENDTLKITYDFCKRNGGMDFVFLNKLNIPLYIDWRKSSFIYNGTKLDFWSDATNVKSLGISKPALWDYYYGYYSKQVSNSVVSKQERITFIAPNSSIKKETFVIYPYKTEMPSDIKPIKIKGYIESNDSITVQKIEYDKPTTPALFRNFMTVSTTEKFEKEFYIDNGFYISGVLQIKKSDIMTYDGNGEVMHIYDPRTFFLGN